MTFLRSLPGRGATQQLVFLLLDGFTQVSFACAMEPLRLANCASGMPTFAWQTLSVDGGPVKSSCGTTILVDGALRNLARADTLLVVGGNLGLTEDIPALPAYLRRQHAYGVAIIGLCGGLEALARARLLNGQECAVDWQFAQGFAERHPATHASDQAFVVSRISTAASGTAAADLMLHLIGQSHGGDLANQVADMMIYGHVRQPGAKQRVSLNALLGVRSEVLSGAIRIMEDHIDSVLQIAEISGLLRTSVRQLERLFARHLNLSPSQYYTRIRLARATALLRETEMSVTEVAFACGFSGPSQFSKTYRKHLGTSPARFRVVQLPTAPVVAVRSARSDCA